MIDKISNATRAAIEAAGAKSLPDNPSGRGMTADEIRRKFWEPLTSAGSNLAKEIDRVVDEANRDIGSLATAINDESSARKAADSKHDDRISSLETTASEVQQEINGKVNSSDVRVDAAAMTIAKRSAFGTLHAITKVNGNLGDDADSVLVNVKYLNTMLDSHKADADNAYAPKNLTEAKFDALFSSVDGLTNSYVADDVNAIQGFLDNGYWEIAGVTYYAVKMKTGDSIFVVDSGCPDFWFEKTSDMGRTPEEITIALDDESTVTLTLRVYFNGNLVGLLHVIEGEKTKIDFSWVEEQIGDIDTALDAILDMQERLIGGEGA